MVHQYEQWKSVLSLSVNLKRGFMPLATLLIGGNPKALNLALTLSAALAAFAGRGAKTPVEARAAAE